MTINKQTLNKLYTHNQDAFKEVYDKFFRIVYYVIYSIVKDREVAEELVQDTFVKMWNNIHLFNIDTNFQAWLLSIAKNIAKDFLRSKKPVQLIEEMQIVCNSMHTKVLYEFNTDVNGVLSELEYDIIVLTVVYNLKRREVAEYLNKPLGTVLRVYKEALDKLKKLYGVNNKQYADKL